MLGNVSLASNPDISNRQSLICGVLISKFSRRILSPLFSLFVFRKSLSCILIRWSYVKWTVLERNITERMLSILITITPWQVCCHKKIFIVENISRFTENKRISLSRFCGILSRKWNEQTVLSLVHVQYSCQHTQDLHFITSWDSQSLCRFQESVKHNRQRQTSWDVA